MYLTYRPPASFHPAQIPHENQPENRRKEPTPAGNPRRRMTGRGDRRSIDALNRGQQSGQADDDALESRFHCARP
jgi:hypothetical protein